MLTVIKQTGRVALREENIFVGPERDVKQLPYWEEQLNKKNIPYVLAFADGFVTDLGFGLQYTKGYYIFTTEHNLYNAD